MDMIAGAAQIESNPFVVLTFIVAPAILTNASALMVLSTSNRFARAIDRARELSRQIEEAIRESNTEYERLHTELLITENRAVLLLRATRSFYFSLGAFAFAVFVSLFGAGLVSMGYHAFDRLLSLSAIASVFFAVSGLVVGSVLLFYETRLVVGILQDRIKRLNTGKI
ncbi:DUF2721 domain-containing protein [Desulfopila sp. IMCC35008]|uniref:DUF2721 domain-containing protein n=1 Tax=Desulfopila sp. IMCC35008 TaxID=2653858 RepID=UPI0013D0EFE3|nr:DUF2721 domain-containing protein [Desulfopila sp. IMCC35008]